MNDKKKKLLFQLMEAYNVALYTIYCYTYIDSRRAKNELIDFEVVAKDEVNKLKMIIPSEPFDRLFNSDSSKDFRLALDINIKRSFANNLFELISNYVKETKQDKIFQAQDWYHFIRIVRNISSHILEQEEIKWLESLANKQILEVTWNGITIKKGMTAKDVKMSTLQLNNLFSEIYEFCQNKLQ